LDISHIGNHVLGLEAQQANSGIEKSLQDLPKVVKPTQVLPWLGSS